jgi:hypothetical protein
MQGLWKDKRKLNRNFSQVRKITNLRVHYLLRLVGLANCNKSVQLTELLDFHYLNISQESLELNEVPLKFEKDIQIS